MTCQQYIPSPPLRQYIAYYWTLESDENDRPGNIYRMVPDGYVDWIFHLKEPWAFSLSNKSKAKKKYRSHVFGQTKSYIDLAMFSGQLFLFGVKFQPWAAHYFWKINMGDATDLEISLHDLGDPALIFLEEKIHAANDITEKIKLVELFFKNILCDQKHNDLKRAINHIFQKSTTKELDINIGQRRLEQRFKSEVGISPKMFHRTIRLNRAIQEMLRCPTPHLTSIAYQFDYFDQSHFIRDFRQFTGLSPSKFLRSVSPSRDIFNLKIR